MGCFGKEVKIDVWPRSQSTPGITTRGMKHNKNRQFEKNEEKEKESGTLKRNENVEAVLNGVTPVLAVDKYVDNTLGGMVETEMNTLTSSNGSEKENKKATICEEEEDKRNKTKEGRCSKDRSEIEDQIKNEQLTTARICKEKKKAKEINLRQVKKKNEETTEKTEDILKRVKSYYKNVNTRETEEEKERVDEFFRKIEYNQVIKGKKVTLTAKLTKEEINKAVPDTDNNKTPGLDGIPYEFYKTHIEKIAENLPDIFRKL
ncbi:hypothetical protein QYM36_014390 [Artemia franciscana]|uniref:Uncharacterized protein n=1 Tax=Artemia franciscana TaxID=6661 RepID=A0AA88L0A8_ARTSF|nr:hypothetical protein QYM36_014390 [Artemia franciscana]